MKLKTVAVLTLLCIATLFATAGFGNQEESIPSAFFPETSYQFSAVLDGTKVMHDFVIQNKGSATLKVDKVKTG